MQLEEMVQWLIGIGAAMGADCKPCLQTCLNMARKSGADEQQIDMATDIGRMVRQCAEQMQKRADDLEPAPAGARTQSASCCGFDEFNSQKERSQ